VQVDDVVAQIETDKVTIDVKYTASSPGERRETGEPSEGEQG
jgi:hypothetical protein